ncbi:MAG: hypothetical protein U9Q04_08735 [Campylobacterota bacterium]|nr:hypothetical protein [Campylobacterota bacterium]
MKKSISLVEVLVSIVLLTVVIAASLQIKQNNLHNLEVFEQKSTNNSYISLSVSSSTSMRNKKVYLSDIVDFGDDDIRKELKEVKVNIKDDELEDVKLPKNDYIHTAKVFESTYTIEDKTVKKFYTFTLK